MCSFKGCLSNFTSDERKSKRGYLVTPLFIIILSALAITEILTWLNKYDTSYSHSNEAHKRTRRFFYMTSERRLNLPKKTKMALDFVLSFPGFNPLPIGFGSESALAIPVDVDLDELGVTSSENNFGELEFFQSLQDQIGLAVEYTQSMIGQVIGPGNLAGGERSLMYRAVESTLHSFGIDGEACLLRTICEVHLHTLLGHGLIGEAIELFLSASKSRFANNLLKAHSEAEKSGKSGDCYEYMEKCPLSVIAPFSKSQQTQEKDHRDKHSHKIVSYGNLNENDSMRFNITNKKSKKSRSKKYYPVLKNETQHWREENLIRHKRFLTFGPASRLLLPEGSLFNTKAELKLPYLRGDLPDGYSSGMNMAGAFRVIFDALGLTSIINPFLRLAFLEGLGRRKRDTWQALPGVNYEGGDREIIFLYLENVIDKLKYNGKACILRAVCEMHEQPFDNHGFLGELLHLFLSPSNAIFSEERLPDYLEAERIGRTAKDCAQYLKHCPFSIFRTVPRQSRNEI